MPNYEFKCRDEKCGHVEKDLMSYEKWCKRKKAPGRCPKCGARMQALFPGPYGRVH